MSETVAEKNAPVAGPLPLGFAIAPSECLPHVEPVLFDAVVFETGIACHELRYTGLATSGFNDDAVTVTAVSLPAQVFEETDPDPEPFDASKLPPAPVFRRSRSTAAYVPDTPALFFDEDDGSEFKDGRVTEPEITVPPIATSLALAEAEPIAPASPKLMQGFGPEALVDDSPVSAPRFAGTTVRQKLIAGPNPNTPKPKTLPNSAPPASKPAVARKQPAMTVKPPVAPVRKPPAPKPLVAASPSDGPVLRMSSLEPAGFAKFWFGASAAVKSAVVAGAIALAIAAGWLVFRPGASSRAAAPSAENTGITEETLPGTIIGGGGWATNWGSDASVNKGKQISIYRPSMNMTDYRIDFRGQIERKAMGWIFRASNPKNYYVLKLEMIKPGLSPVVALVKYSVTNGKENTHTQAMLPFEVKMDTLYSVRTDVNGNKFTTYVNDKLVDHWNDDAVKTGGAGFYNETGERALIKSSRIVYLK